MTEMLASGTRAPDFRLRREDGTEISLKSLHGSKVVLYFYPRADTPGCTKEAIAFNGKRKDFEKAGTVILGVSADPVKAHDGILNLLELAGTNLGLKTGAKSALVGSSGFGTVRAGINHSAPPSRPPAQKAGSILHELAWGHGGREDAKNPNRYRSAIDQAASSRPG